MTSLTEPRTPGAESEPAVAAGWRKQVESAQENVLPEGRVVVSCGPPPGLGGLGRHVQEIAAALDRRATPRTFLCAPADPRTTTGGALRRLGSRAADAALALPP